MLTVGTLVHSYNYLLTMLTNVCTFCERRQSLKINKFWSDHFSKKKKNWRTEFFYLAVWKPWMDSWIYSLYNFNVKILTILLMRIIFSIYIYIKKKLIREAVVDTNMGYMWTLSRSTQSSSIWDQWHGKLFDLLFADFKFGVGWFDQTEFEHNLIHNRYFCWIWYNLNNKILIKILVSTLWGRWQYSCNGSKFHRYSQY